MLATEELESFTNYIVNPTEIDQVLTEAQQSDSAKVREVLAKARELQGLSLSEVALLCQLSDPELLHELFSTASWVKERIYGKRLVLFAPLYISNICDNECSYCAFRKSNESIVRMALSQEEIADETRSLVKEGHKRVLLVAGESAPQEGFSYFEKAIQTIYSAKEGSGEIRRINVNLAPLSVEEFERLQAAQIGTYQLFQETYHRPTYAAMHTEGKKADYNWRITVMDRAMLAGMNDVGIGVLFGLHDWRFEVLALMQHSRYLEQRFGTGPHTISVPRIEPAGSSQVAAQPPAVVSDADFKKIVAVLRLAVPYTGIIMSTRETAEMRRETFSLGVSQISAGSRTNPGGYSALNGEDNGQFSLGDHRSLDQVIRDVAELGYIPSFCTACYRLGRTGADFMDLAKPGEIRRHCDPNGFSSFVEYLMDYASAETKAAGEKAIGRALEDFEPQYANHAEQLIQLVRKGERDVYC